MLGEESDPGSRVKLCSPPLVGMSGLGTLAASKAVDKKRSLCCLDRTRLHGCGGKGEEYE